MMDRQVTDADVHWIVSILNDDTELILNRERLYGAFGLPQSALHDLNTTIRVNGLGSYSFFREVILKWVSLASANTFDQLVKILDDEQFINTGALIRQRVLHGPNEGGAGSGSQRSIWFDVPQKIVLFTGRIGVLEDLHSAITARSNDATVLTTLSGLGGIGKTTVSVEYAWKYYEEEKFYTHVIWLNSETIDALLDSFNRLARDLEIQVQDDNLVNLVHGVYEYFYQRGKALFIFDNVECYDIIRPYLPKIVPRIVKPFILLTSRNRNWNDRVKQIRLEVFTENESMEHLTKYLGLQSENELKYAKEISAILGNLPLGIRQACAYIKVQRNLRGCSMEEQMKQYLNTWQKNSKLTLRFPYWNQTDDFYENTVYLTWNFTLDKIKEKNPLSVRIMRIICYFNPDNIPLELFYNLEAPSKKMHEEEAVNEAIDLLNSYSMITKAEKKPTFNIHRLVQSVVRIQTERKLDSRRLREAKTILEVALRQQSCTAVEETCLVHAQTVLRHLERSTSVKENEWKVFLRRIAQKRVDQIHLESRLLRYEYTSRGYERAYEFFLEVDSSYSVKRLKIDSSTYVSIYYGGFIEYVVMREIVSELQEKNPKYERVVSLENQTRRFFNKCTETCEMSTIGPNSLGTMVSSILNHAKKLTETTLKSDLVGIALHVFNTIITCRRVHYFRTIGGFTNFIDLLECLRDLQKPQEIIALINSSYKMVNDETIPLPLPDTFFEIGLEFAKSLVQYQYDLGSEVDTNGLVLLALKLFRLVYKQRIQTVDYFSSVISDSARGILKCLTILNRTTEILEFILEFKEGMASIDYWKPPGVERLISEMADCVCEMANDPNLRNIKTDLLQNADGLRESANNSHPPNAE